MMNASKKCHIESVPRTDGRPRMFVIRLPMHMASAFMVPIRPLMLIGEISDRYRGHTPQKKPLQCYAYFIKDVLGYT